MAFIRFLLIGFLSYWLIKQLVRIFLPKVLKNFMNKMNNIQEEPRKKEGETTIITGAPKESDKLKDAGDYVDYEEIDE